MEEHLKCNIIFLEGEVVSGLEFSHELFGEKFYLFTLAVQRLSDKKDMIQITISEKIVEEVRLTVGAKIAVTGQLRSYNKMVEGRNKLVLTVFAREICECIEKSEDPNQIDLEGFICKKPVFRTTPFGREIADVLIAVNRPYNKSDYIPVIAWGRNARFAGSLEVGVKVRIHGRFQSREYQKNLSESESMTKIAYEVSVSQIQRVPEEVSEEPKEEDAEILFRFREAVGSRV